MPKKPIINYSNRNFDTIKNDLIQHARRYYPTIYDDFSDASIGSMLFDSVAYVGDMLSFYLDFQVNESVLETAIDYNNVRKLASNMGYNFYGRPAAFGLLDVFILVPANSTGLGPDLTYLPILRSGASFSSVDGEDFVLLEDLDFTAPNTPYVAARFDNTTAKPTHYALKKTGQIKSGNFFTITENVDFSTRFPRLEVGPSVINEIISVFDLDGRQYYQVENLTQEVVYLNTTNPNAIRDGVPKILKPHIAARRFVVEQDSEATYLRFGYGSDNELDISGIISPSDKILKLTGKNYITDTGFDPNKFLNTSKFGIAPRTNTLRITYYSNLTAIDNVSVGSINVFKDGELFFPNSEIQTGTEFSAVFSSIESANPFPISQENDYPTIDEIKYRAYAIYSSQNRTVTKEDYEAYCYQMPPSFGIISRVSVANDPSASNKRMIIYCVSKDNSGNLVKTNDTIKNNLRIWLNKNRMISDKLEIRDAKIINIGFTFSFTIDPSYNGAAVLSEVYNRLSDKFSEKMYIGEPFYLTDIYKTINRTTGVVDTVKVEPRIFSGGEYSNINILIDSLKSPDGTFLKTPKNCILEIKNFFEVVTGTITQ